MAEDMPLKEETAAGTYTVSVRWSGGTSCEVEADSEAEAVAKAIDKCESGFMESDITSYEVEWFDPNPEACPDKEAKTAAEWADLMVHDFLRSGLARTPVAGIPDFRKVPPAVIRVLKAMGDPALVEDQDVTYLVRSVEDSPPKQPGR